MLQDHGDGKETQTHRVGQRKPRTSWAHPQEEKQKAQRSTKEAEKTTQEHGNASETGIQKRWERKFSHPQTAPRCPSSTSLATRLSNSETRAFNHSTCQFKDSTSADFSFNSSRWHDTTSSRSPLTRANSANLSSKASTTSFCVASASFELSKPCSFHISPCKAAPGPPPPLRADQKSRTDRTGSISSLANPSSHSPEGHGAHGSISGTTGGRKPPTLSEGPGRSEKHRLSFTTLATTDSSVTTFPFLEEPPISAPTSRLLQAEEAGRSPPREEAGRSPPREEAGRSAAEGGGARKRRRSLKQGGVGETGTGTPVARKAGSPESF
ncbi:uncharacterized protein G2W53_010393 [Senna tora]|uniref:Uncharacterized protein n=1 Tax=Senna tora TaxID=362788 RepID=A0A834X060_9FABA|nr:uncharacterized protein G2W53_010393 [Senna tora]